MSGLFQTKVDNKYFNKEKEFKGVIRILADKMSKRYSRHYHKDYRILEFFNI